MEVTVIGYVWLTDLSWEGNDKNEIFMLWMLWRDILNRLSSLSKKCPCSELLWSAFFPHFLAFGLITERYAVFSPNEENAKKMWTRITPNTDTFYAVHVYSSFMFLVHVKLISLTLMKDWKYFIWGGIW